MPARPTPARMPRRLGQRLTEVRCAAAGKPPSKANALPRSLGRYPGRRPVAILGPEPMIRPCIAPVRATASGSAVDEFALPAARPARNPLMSHPTADCRLPTADCRFFYPPSAQCAHTSPRSLPPGTGRTTGRPRQVRRWSITRERWRARPASTGIVRRGFERAFDRWTVQEPTPAGRDCCATPIALS